MMNYFISQRFIQVSLNVGNGNFEQFSFFPFFKNNQVIQVCTFFSYLSIHFFVMFVAFEFTLKVHFSLKFFIAFHKIESLVWLMELVNQWLLQAKALLQRRYFWNFIHVGLFMIAAFTLFALYQFWHQLYFSMRYLYLFATLK